MDESFPRSSPLLRDLAAATKQRQPDGTTQDYVDQGFAIIINASEYHKKLQEKAVRQEFILQRDYMDKRFETVEERIEMVDRGLQSHMDDQYRGVNRRFEKVEKKLESMEQKMDKKLESMEQRMDKKFGGMEQRMDKKFGELEAAIHDFRAMAVNGNADRGIKTLQPVGVYHPNRGYFVPENFPRTVGEFWKLKRTSKLPQLISLCLFYGITREELTGLDMDEDTKETEAYTSLTLKQLIEKYPDLAHMALADRFGLKYAVVAEFMKRLEEFRDQSTGKRSVIDQGTEATRKSARIERSRQGDANIERGSHKATLENTPSTVESIRSDRTQLGWAKTSEREKFDAYMAEINERREREEDQKLEAERIAALPYQVIPAAGVLDSTKQSPSKNPSDSNTSSRAGSVQERESEVAKSPEPGDTQSQRTVSTELIESPARSRRTQLQPAFRPKSTKSQRSAKGMKE
ncbi:hypothetical protein CPC735_051420 [Coccidioides posadasii C735 delta SOWgp]|uniref:Uncharacterized protein n=1 Tax=Coccidioides posadasii (strain C735) TaxID=222929 RepID=C5PGW9_COCP7|nr:hypothetical protein CPC735_051420 [Coccidioides posadasii C735 delta SOWgp]EER23772.1 hypothetical protein CPC735_051420 [Coccidioides posadasii C735 delta SOWgp]|eukprot:XP_003065917.1 hypothetical protein CPC735_051420 [Coccidioides posadasii C735 delta SOWgp]